MHSMQPKFKIGDLVGFPPKDKYDPKNDYGIIVSIIEVPPNSSEYDSRWIYTIHWAIDGEITMDESDYIDKNVELISGVKTKT